MAQMHFEGAPFGWDFNQGWISRLGEALGIKEKGWSFISLMLAGWLTFYFWLRPELQEAHAWWQWVFFAIVGLVVTLFVWAFIVVVAVLLDILYFRLVDKQQCLHWVTTKKYPKGCIMVFDYDGKSPYPVPEGYDNEPFLLMRHGWFRHSLIIDRAGAAKDTPIRYFSRPERRLVIGPEKCSIIGGRLDEMMRLIAHDEVGYNYGGRLVDGSKAEEENYELKLRVKRLESENVLGRVIYDLSAVVQSIAQDKARRPNQALARVRRLLEAVLKSNELPLCHGPDMAQRVHELEGPATPAESSKV